MPRTMNTSRYVGKYVSEHIGMTLRFPEQWLYVLLTVTTVCAYFIRSTYLAVIACDDEQIGTIGLKIRVPAGRS